MSEADEMLLDEKYAEVSELVSAIREVYALAGEDENVARICNRILESSSYSLVM